MTEPKYPPITDEAVTTLAAECAIESKHIPQLHETLRIAQIVYFHTRALRDEGGTPAKVRDAIDRVATRANALAEAVDSLPPFARARLSNWHHGEIDKRFFPSDLAHALAQPCDPVEVEAVGGVYSVGLFSRAIGWDGAELDVDQLTLTLKAVAWHCYESNRRLEQLLAQTAERAEQEGTPDPLRERDHAYRQAVGTVMSFWKGVLHRPVTIDNTDRGYSRSPAALFAQEAFRIFTDGAALPNKVSSMIEAGVANGQWKDNDQPAD